MSHILSVIIIYLIKNGSGTSIHLSPTHHGNVFERESFQNNLRRNNLLKLPYTKTCQYVTQALCFKGSLLWNNVNEFKNEEMKIFNDV